MNFFWLAEQAWSAVTYFWPISVSVIAVLLAALFFTRRRLLQASSRGWILLLSAFLVPPAILLWGSIMQHSDAYTAAPRWPSHVLAALLIVAVAFFTLVIWRAAGLRWLALAVVLASAWLSLCAAFVAGMSLTNNWL